MNIAVKTNDLFVTVDGLNTRYFEEGAFGEGGGVPAIMLHGSSLGSSADVFRRDGATCRASARPIRRRIWAAPIARNSSCVSWMRSACGGLHSLAIRRPETRPP